VAQMSRKSAFLTGTLCGILLAVVVMAVVGYIALEQGLTVEVETGAIAELVRAQVEDYARQELPRVISQLKSTMPAGIASRLTKSLESATIKLYDTEIHLPDAAVEELNGNLREMVLAEIDKSFSRLDTDQLVREWGTVAEESVRSLLVDELDCKTFVVEPYAWLSVPVTVFTGR